MGTFMPGFTHFPFIVLHVARFLCRTSACRSAGVKGFVGHWTLAGGPSLRATRTFQASFSSTLLGDPTTCCQDSTHKETNLRQITRKAAQGHLASHLQARQTSITQFYTHSPAHNPSQALGQKVRTIISLYIHLRQDKDQRISHHHHQIPA